MKGEVAKEGIGGLTAIATLEPGALIGVDVYPPAVEAKPMTPVVAGVTMLVTGVVMLVTIVPMLVFTTEPGGSTAELEEGRICRRTIARPLPCLGVTNCVWTTELKVTGLARPRPADRGTTGLPGPMNTGGLKIP